VQVLRLVQEAFRLANAPQGAPHYHGQALACGRGVGQPCHADGFVSGME
jgi:hypothetical protein